MKYRVLLRAFSCYFFYILSKIINKKIVLCGVDYYKKYIKTSDTLFVIGPGGSLLSLTSSDYKYIKFHDSIALNYTISHNINFKCNLFEPHNTSEKGYFEILVNKNIKKNNSFFLIKGYNSPKKIYCFIKNIISFKKYKINKLLLMKDGYLSDYDKELTIEINDSERNDFIFNHLASIIYCVDLAMITGYKNIVFCGVDMSHDYFYFHKNYLPVKNIKQLKQLHSMNLHATNKKLQKNILDYLNKLRLSSIIEMHVYKCKGPLANILPEYELNSI